MQVELHNEERKRQQFEKQQAEDALKRERKVKGKQELDKWNDQRKKEIEARRKNNEEQEKLYHENVKIQRNGPNPWERVIANCDLSTAN